MDYSAVEVLKDGRVGRIMLNRPRSRNALNNQLMDEVIEALAELDYDEEIRVIVIGGNGPIFCSGADLKETATENREHNPKDWHTHLQRFLNVSLSMWDAKKPVITAVHGAALGGGFDLALMGDITFAGEKTIFGLPEVRGLSSELTLILPWVTGMKKAKELLLMGDTFDANEALRLGLINRVVPEEEVLNEALTWAKRLAMMPAMTLRMNKLSINKAYEIMGFKTSQDFNLEASISIYMTYTPEERKERNQYIREHGVKAWLELEKTKYI